MSAVLWRASTLNRHACLPVIYRRTLFSLSDFPSFLPFNESDEDDKVQTYHERKIMPYTRKQLYRLVADVEAYPHFVPFCKRSRLLTNPAPLLSDEEIAFTVDAELTVGFPPLEETYLSKVTGTPFEKVEAISSSALFTQLTTTWRFQPASGGSPHPTHGQPHSTEPVQSDSSNDDGPTLLSIDLSYGFSSPLYGTLASKAMAAVSQQIMTAFERRCLEVYGDGFK